MVQYHLSFNTSLTHSDEKKPAKWNGELGKIIRMLGKVHYSAKLSVLRLFDDITTVTVY